MSHIYNSGNSTASNNATSNNSPKPSLKSKEKKRDGPLHESTEKLPGFESAPPSGNMMMMDVAADPLLSMALPPPPPPPPPRIHTTQNLGATTTATTLSSTPPRSNRTIDVSDSSHLLPPPPQIATPPRQPEKDGEVPVVTVPGGPPLPPPPPPPPPMPNLPPASNSLPLPTNTTTDNVQPPQAQEQKLDVEGPGTTSEPSPLSITTFAPKTIEVLAQRQTHIPILVISTENANALAWKNQLQLTDMFQGVVHDLKLSTNQNQRLPPFRSINSKSLNITSLKVKFVSQLGEYDYAQAHTLLQSNAKLQDADGNVAQELLLLEDRVDELLQDRNNKSNSNVSGADNDYNKENTTNNVETLEDVTKDAYNLTSPLDIPWLIRYRLAIDASTNNLPHDLINCPPLILTVCTTDEIESPIEVLQELNQSPHVLPGPFKNGLYDPNTIRHEVLVLHDSVAGPQDLDEYSLRQALQQRFGPNSALLRVNSVLPGTAAALSEQEDTDLWGGHGKKGNYLSVNDRVLLRRYFQTLLTSSLLPALERRIADLNAIVSERKKGVRNLVKSFWRKPKESSSSNNHDSTMMSGGSTMMNSSLGGSSMNDTSTSSSSDRVKYRYDTIESQTRLLADTLFLIHDYEAAVSIYRLIRDDYKSDKAMTHYANVHEMMALCYYHMDPYLRAKDIFTHLETALLAYTRAAEEERASWIDKDPSARPTAAPHSTRLATRLCLLLAASSETLTQGRELEVADLLASASSHESSLGAAVLLEQSSAFYYHAGMYRKYAFHMLMSGHMFRSAGQDDHAFRCFTSALYVYRHGEWDELHNHLRSALAAQLYTMGRMSIALVLYAKLVCTASGGTKISAKSQQKFVNHLLEICADHPKAALAGADRMASPSSLPSNEREAFRNAQLERIVNVIRFSKGSSRVLELPYMNLPQIVDKSVRIWTHAEQHFVSDSDDDDNEEENGSNEVEQSISPQFGKVSKGNNRVWEDLQMLANAEMHASHSNKPKLDESVTAALSKIKDPHHRVVIAQLDKEKSNRAMQERNRRNNSNYKPTATVRTRGEPLFCEFVVKNPLSVDIQVAELQLVAKMVDKNNKVCTNQDAIKIRTIVDDSKQTSWTFPSTDNMEFSVADFCRIAESGTKSCVSAKDNPFFVVTKLSLSLSAGEETIVSAGLTPLVTGELEILGVRCKLSDKVWVYHPFNILGPLLNNSRTNRANRGKYFATIIIIIVAAAAAVMRQLHFK